MTVTMYHNPRCSKSRQTLELLRRQGIEPRIIEYLREPPTREELREILRLLGMQPRQLMRTKEAPYREQELDRDGITGEQLLAAMLDYPILIERPIVVANGKAAIGRPPEAVLEILA